MRLLLIFLLFISLLAPFSSCKKGGEETPAKTPRFTISGLRDVDFSTVSGNEISYEINVTSTNGVPDTVFLYANELPNGIYVEISPIYAVTPFKAKVTVRTYTYDSKTYPIQINGSGRSGLLTYKINVTQPGFRGWQLDAESFGRDRVEVTPGSGSTPPRIRCVSTNGAQLVLLFAVGSSLPTGTSVYSVGALPGPNTIQITHGRGEQNYVSTGNGAGSSSATFTLGADGKLNFKCNNVELADTVQRKSLTANFSE